MKKKDKEGTAFVALSIHFLVAFGWLSHSSYVIYFFAFLFLISLLPPIVSIAT